MELLVLARGPEESPKPEGNLELNSNRIVYSILKASQLQFLVWSLVGKHYIDLTKHEP